MRVALILPEPPAPMGNAASRWFYVLVRELLARRDVDLTILSGYGRQENMEAAKQQFESSEMDIRYFPYRSARSLRSKLRSFRRPFSYIFSRELIRELDRVCGVGVDLIHVEQIWGLWATIGRRVPVLGHVHYLPSLDFEGFVPHTTKDHVFTRLALRAEKRLLGKAQHIMVASDDLEARVRQQSRAHIYRNALGIDVSRYKFVEDQERENKLKVTLIGSMGWWPSRSAAIRLATRIWPKVREQVPEATLQIVGWDARKALASVIGESGVEVQENVPDIRPYFRKAGVMVYAPESGSGMKIKVMECMAVGVPLVTNKHGLEGLPRTDAIMHAETDEEFIAATVKILRDIKEQNRMRREARHLLAKVCDPQTTVDRVCNAYESILGGTR